MKKYIYFVGILLTTMFYSCDLRDLEAPVIEAPSYEPTSELMTIAELKTFAEPKIFGSNPSEANNNFGFLQNPDNITVLDANGIRSIVSLSDVGLTNKHLKATVVGNDESGNIYKQLYLQDETGSILLVVNLTGVFGQYTVGQNVIVELDNLCVGKYYGAYQIGAPILSKSVSSSGNVNYGMNRLTPRYFYECIHRNGEVNKSQVESLLKTYESIPLSVESVRNTLVKFDNVSFDGGGIKQFAPMVNDEPTTGTVVLNVNGVKIDVRTSGYANFAADTIPSGTGSITAILSQYFEKLQLTIRTRDDLNFKK